MIDRRIFIASLLAGCGGAENDSVPLRSAGKRRNATIATTDAVMFGDSTEASTRLDGCPTPSSEAQKFFDVRAMAYRVRHEAVGGSSAGMLLRGEERVHTVHFSEYIHSVMDLIVGFRFGLNERRLGETHQTFHDNLSELVAIARGAGKLIVLTTPSPIEYPEGRIEYVEGPGGSCDVIRDVYARNADICVLNDLNRIGHKLGYTATLDGLHPTPEMMPWQGRRLALSIAAL